MQILRVGMSPQITGEFLAAAEKLSNQRFSELYIGSTADLVSAFKVVDAALQFLEQSLSDTTKLNLKK